MFIAEGPTLASFLNVIVSVLVTAYGIYVTFTVTRWLPHDDAVPILRTLYRIGLAIMIMMIFLTAAAIASRIDPTRNYSAWVAVFARIVAGVAFFTIHQVGNSVWRRRAPRIQDMEDDTNG